MLNRKYFYELQSNMLRIIKNSSMSDKEKKSRVEKSKKILLEIFREEKINNHYYSLAHELKSYELLKMFGIPKIAEDSKSETGPDIKLGNYQIECVCCSPGETLEELNKYRINEYRKSIVCDYNKKMEIILPRITSALNEKRDKFNKYQKNKIVNSNDKCIIFISLGELYFDFMTPEYGFDLLNVLVGKGCMSLTIDRDSGKITDKFYNHVETIKKHNGKDIDANFFLRKENEHISGIIFANVNMCEEYNLNNTFLFLNPYAKNKISVKDFNGMIYWRSNSRNKYIPRKNGKNLWSKLERKFF